MSALTPSLPQNDSPSEQQQRRVALVQQQQIHAYDFTSGLNPLGIVAQLPTQDKPTYVWLEGVVTTTLQSLGNCLSIAANRFDNGKVLSDADDSGLSEQELREVEDVYKRLTDGFRRLSECTSRLHQVHRMGHLVQEVAEEVNDEVADGMTGATPVVAVKEDVEPISDDIHELVQEPLLLLVSDAGTSFLRFVGMLGQAALMEDAATPFCLPLPSVASDCDTDLLFARMRLAGPNPLVIRRLTPSDSRLPVTDAQLQAVTGPADSLSRAHAEGRLYLADYAVLDGLKTGQTSGGQKSIEAPLALFVVPPPDTSDRSLRPVAIQLSQRAGASLFTPADGSSWLLARRHVQVADDNYHELISHLGLTYLVLEQFAMATSRHLPVQHPLYLLLRPHFQGTLSIHTSAENSLMALGGPVDPLLAGEIDASSQLCIQAVRQQRINQSFLPQALALRGVEDCAKLPDYPYRDDALLLWRDILCWVNGYLSLYYQDDAAVQADYELQAWIQELGRPDGGQLREIGEANGGIQTRAYLVDLVTYILFTASAQHATVNFPQRTLMTGPMSVDPGLPESTQPLHLPPVQRAVLQQGMGSGPGNISFTRLGDYDAYLRGPWFTDPRVSPLLKVFQERLRVTEKTIGRRNRSRIPYETLLPSSIPQSISI